MNDNSDKLFSARLSDMTEQARRKGCCVFSAFLDERQCAEAEIWCRHSIGDLMYRLWGGHPEAKRKMLAVFPEYCESCVDEEYPFVCLTLTYREEDRLTHRDILGTFMGLRLKREVIGDIIVSEGKAQTFVTEVGARHILSSVSKIGRVGIKITDELPFDMEVHQEYQKISGTVASLRLDCLVSLAAHLSRENAAKLIRSERVEVNHFTASSVSRELCEGDVISVRGSGRFILSAVNGLSGKGRIHVDLLKYI